LARESKEKVVKMQGKFRAISIITNFSVSLARQLQVANGNINEV